LETGGALADLGAMQELKFRLFLIFGANTRAANWRSVSSIGFRLIRRCEPTILSFLS
jgi:hypothetical protein